MYRIERITNDAYQKQNLVLSDGTQVVLTMYFVPMQYGWFITELVYGDFILKGLRITNSPNILHQFRNKIPFGLACFSKAKREPMFIDDFSQQNSKLYILTSSEVTYYSGLLTGA
jgi:hypothetical protein